ncbi:ArsR family transcriptional regulator [Halobacteriales archaeon QS_8_69_26]|nr:MAG: ArsR family transcriptional regulator [Halobacteriales archaeon QS_8_69_26]
MSGVADADPTEAFEIVDDGTRVAILRALAERRAEHPRDPALSFSELRKRVGTRDSGRFNYHLDRLRGRFVEKHGESDGYVLTPSGQKVVSAVLAGAYERGEDRGPMEVDADCFVCGAPLSAEYVDGMVRVTCEHGHGFRDTAPPGAVEDRRMEEVLMLADRVARQEIELAVEGVCPECFGPAPPSIVSLDEDERPHEDTTHLFVSVCERCGMTSATLVGCCVVRHPAVVSLYYEHGIDVRERPVWELGFVAEGPVVEGEDPLRLRVDVAVGDDAVALTLDGTATVVDVERSPA